MSELIDIDYPELSDRTIEAKAQQLIEDFSAHMGMQVGVPMPVEVIAEMYLNYQLDILDGGSSVTPTICGHRF